MRLHSHQSQRPRFCLAGVTLLFLLGLGGPPPAAAHQGPPFPVFVDQAAGSYVVSLWADPDIGTGTFWITLDPQPGKTLPSDTAVEVIVRPLSGRLPEARYSAPRQHVRDQQQYLARVPFDTQDHWRVRILLHGTLGTGEVVAEVESTPPGLGPLDLLLYLFPFAAVGFLWLRAALVRRGGRVVTRRGHVPRRPSPGEKTPSG
jgi:hypothetical protein